MGDTLRRGSERGGEGGRWLAGTDDSSTLVLSASGSGDGRRQARSRRRDSSIDRKSTTTTFTSSCLLDFRLVPCDGSCLMLASASGPLLEPFFRASTSFCFRWRDLAFSGTV